jgi:hypothetical protein
MRVRAGVAPRVASGDPAASKGKSAGGASFGKRRVGREERCAATHASLVHFWHLQMSGAPAGASGLKRRSPAQVVEPQKAVADANKPSSLGPALSFGVSKRHKPSSALTLLTRHAAAAEALIKTRSRDHHLGPAPPRHYSRYYSMKSQICRNIFSLAR